MGELRKRDRVTRPGSCVSDSDSELDDDDEDELDEEELDELDISLILIKYNKYKSDWWFYKNGH